MLLGTKQHGSDSRTDERTEQICTHTSDVADIVTDIISNNCRIAWVVLRQATLNLADKISTNVSSLGVDTTTNTSKD